MKRGEGGSGSLGPPLNPPLIGQPLLVWFVTQSLLVFSKIFLYTFYDDNIAGKMW